MPERADGQPPKEALRDEHALVDHDRQQAARHTEGGVQGQVGQAGIVVRGDGEERAGAEDGGVDPRGQGGGDHQGHECPRRELEEEQLDGEHDRRQGRPEGGGHARGRPARQKDLPFRWRYREDLADERAECAGGDDDGAFGTEGPAGTDSDCRGEWFRHRGPGADPALVGQDRLHRLRDAVPPDLRRPPGEQRYGHAAGGRHGDEAEPGMEVGERGDRPADLPEEGQIGQQADQSEKHECRASPGQPQAGGQHRQQQETMRGGPRVRASTPFGCCAGPSGSTPDRLLCQCQYLSYHDLCPLAASADGPPGTQGDPMAATACICCSKRRSSWRCNAERAASCSSPRAVRRSR